MSTLSLKTAAADPGLPAARDDRPGDLRMPRLADQRLHWVIESRRASDWGDDLSRLGGGFFAAPPSIAITNPSAEPVFCRLQRGGVTVGLALGARTGCALSRRRQHYHFASPPVFAADVQASDAIRDLVSTLRGDGCVEVSFGSFDADEPLEVVGGANAGRLRQEFVVPLDGGPEVLLARCSSTHRRHIRRGESRGWTLTALDSDAASTVLHQVQGAATDRAIGRGDRMTLLGPEELRYPADDPSAPWGTRTFAVHDHDGLLSAVLVGWAGRRVYYLIGGSTPRGYQESSAPWLHWKLMEIFRGQGHELYNLGGTSLSARENGDPAHGLYRFKAGFGGQVVVCQGTTWPLRRLHLSGHALLQRASSLLHRFKAR